MTRMQNPFPVTPALRLSHFQLTSRVGPDFTVPTSSIDRARDNVRGYLDEADRWEAERESGAEPRPLSGRVIGVVGDYGSGKTHQLIDIARLVHESSGAMEHGAKVRLLLLDAPRGGIAAAYRDQLIGQFDPDAIVELLKDYYGDTVADGVEGVPVPPGSDAENDQRDIASALRKGELDPEGVSQAYHLPLSTIEQNLTARLRGVAEHWEFARALTLMLDPPMRGAAWRWFRGDAPGAELVKREITAPIATESMAYDALAVLAFLHGRRGQRIVFIVDEFEKLLEDTDVGRLASLQAFERLAGVFIDAGCLLIFSASHEAADQLSDGLRERTQKVSLAPFDPAQTGQLIQKHLPRALEQVPVFPPATTAYVSELGEGNPRRVISLCRGGFGEAVAGPTGDAAVTVTEDNVRDSARREWERFSLPEARNAVRRILHSDGWPLPADGPRGSRPAVDFWVDADDAVIAVIVTSSLLSAQDATAHFGLVHAAEVYASPEPCEIIIVVNGHVSRSARDALAERIRRDPVIHQGTGFANAFRAALLDAHRRLHNQARRDDLAAIRAKVEQLGRQQAQAQQALDRLLRQSAPRTPLGPAGTGPRPAVAGPAVPGHVADAAVTGLPAEVLDEFQRALDAIPVDRSAERLFDALFRPPGDDEWAVSPRRTMRRDQFEAIGVIRVTGQLVLAFLDAVARWHAAAPPGDAGTRDAEREEELHHICRTYESATEDVLPLLSRMRAYTGAGTLDELGSRVRDLLLR